MENNKYLLTSLLLFCYLNYCQSQSFSIDFDDQSKITAYFTTNDNSLYFTWRNGQNSTILSKIDSAGNKLWSNEIKEVRARNNSLFEKHRSNKHIVTDSKDICFARNYIENDTSKFLVTRISPFGEIVWTKGFKYFASWTISHPTLFKSIHQKS
jgi:hypothetical protein